MLWCSFSWNGVVVKIVGNMDATYYICNILMLLCYHTLKKKYRYDKFFSAR